MLSLRKLVSGARAVRFCSGRFLSTGGTPADNECLILTETVDPGIFVLTLNNEKRGNSLTFNLITQLNTALKLVEESQDARALILRGAGRFFSTGHDIHELIEDSTTVPRGELFSMCAEVMQDLERLPIPTIAAVHGPAHAAGCQLAATCDLLVAAQSATFATPGVKLGLFCTTPAVALVRAIGIRAAREMLYTGLPIKAERALQLGLAHRVVPDDQLWPATLELAQVIAAHSQPVVRMGKKALNTQINMSNVSEAYEVANQVMLQNLQLKDTQAGLRSFVEKQPLPNWTHKSE